LITPNLTEVALLLDKAYAPERGKDDALALTGCGCDVLITSAKDGQGGDAIVGCEKGRTFEIPFERVPGHKWGTGDLFTALLIDGILAGKSLETAARNAGLHVAAQLRGEEESLLPEQ
jgi:pyridoxal/pyridoxine/pyridoxamine kinase